MMGVAAAMLWNKKKQAFIQCSFGHTATVPYVPGNIFDNANEKYEDRGK